MCECVYMCVWKERERERERERGERERKRGERGRETQERKKKDKVISNIQVALSWILSTITGKFVKRP